MLMQQEGALRYATELTLILTGIGLGFLAFQIKEFDEEADAISADIGRSSYETCLEHNQFLQRFAPEEKKLDCDAEFLD